MIAAVILIWTDPLNIGRQFDSSKSIGIYAVPGLIFILLWKNNFYLTKNLVMWNEKMLFIKINESKTTTLNWEDIIDVSFDNDFARINIKNKENGDFKNINLKNIEPYSIEELKNFFQNRSYIT